MARTTVETTPTAALEHVDQIFGLIAAHKKAQADYEAAIDLETALEEELPANKRRTGRHAGQKLKITKTDDPRWIATQKKLNANSLDDAAWALVEKPPVTLAGLGALVDHAVKHVEKGETFPEGQEDINHRDGWTHRMHKIVADHLGLLAGAEPVRDLEGPICDVENMADMVTYLCERLLGSASDVEGNRLTFAVYHLDNMVKDFKKRFDAALYGERVDASH